MNRNAAWAMGLVAVLYGIGLPLTKLMSADPLVAVAARMWVAAPILALITLMRRQRLDRRVMVLALGGGALMTSNLLFAFIAVHRTSIATVAVFQAMQPAAVLVIARPMLGERAGRRATAWTAVAAAGAVTVVLGSESEVRGDVIGLVAALAVMLTWVGFTIMNRWLRASIQVDPVTWMAAITVGSALLLAPFAALASSPADLELGLGDWLVVVYLAIPVAIVGHIVLVWASRYLPAARSTLLLLGMNVVSVAASWPINGERITWIQALGGAVLLAAIAAVTVQQSTRCPETVRLAN